MMRPTRSGYAKWLKMSVACYIMCFHLLFIYIYVCVCVRARALHVISCAFTLYINIYIYTIKGEGDTAWEAEEHSYTVIIENNASKVNARKYRVIRPAR